jgi:hypothetical protein
MCRPKIKMGGEGGEARFWHLAPPKRCLGGNVVYHRAWS